MKHLKAALLAAGLMLLWSAAALSAQDAVLEAGSSDMRVVDGSVLNPGDRECFDDTGTTVPMTIGAFGE